MITVTKFNGGRLKKSRIARGWSIRELAARMGIQPSQISRWEAGKSRPRRPMLIKLARVMNLPQKYFETVTSILRKKKEPVIPEPQSVVQEQVQL